MFKITQNYVIVFLKIIKRKQTSSTALKTIFSFSGRSEKMVFPKKSHWTMIFFVLSWKMIFLLPEKMILSPRRKIKDDLPQKNKQKTHTWEYDIFFRCSEKMVFSKKLQWNMIFLVLPGKMGFFPENLIFFLWAENERWYLPRNTWKSDIFYIYVQVPHAQRHASLPKTVKDDLTSKNSPKGDWRPRLTP